MLWDCFFAQAFGIINSQLVISFNKYSWMTVYESIILRDRLTYGPSSISLLCPFQNVYRHKKLCLWCLNSRFANTLSRGSGVLILFHWFIDLLSFFLTPFCVNGTEQNRVMYVKLWNDFLGRSWSSLPWTTSPKSSNPVWQGDIVLHLSISLPLCQQYIKWIPTFTISWSSISTSWYLPISINSILQTRRNFMSSPNLHVIQIWFILDLVMTKYDRCLNWSSKNSHEKIVLLLQYVRSCLGLLFPFVVGFLPSILMVFCCNSGIYQILFDLVFTSSLDLKVWLLSVVIQRIGQSCLSWFNALYLKPAALRCWIDRAGWLFSCVRCDLKASFSQLEQLCL